MTRAALFGPGSATLPALCPHPFSPARLLRRRRRPRRRGLLWLGAGSREHLRHADGRADDSAAEAGAATTGAAVAFRDVAGDGGVLFAHRPGLPGVGSRIHPGKVVGTILGAGDWVVVVGHRRVRVARQRAD